MVRYRTPLTDSSRWEGFQFRPGDIVISTPPKCGTTWMQMMCALLIFGGPDLPGRLADLSPWLDIQTESPQKVLAALAAQTHRRFIKSHTPLDGIPFDESVTYIGVGRDPRDVAVSWANHFDNMNLDRVFTARMEAVGMDDLADLAPPALPPPDPEGQFWFWMEDDTPATQSVTGLRLTLHHLDTFWQARERPNVALFHYADLSADLEAEMRHLARLLDIPVDEERWPRLVAAAGFASMRERADELAPELNVEGFWKDTSSFFHRGGTGQWAELVRPEDEERYRRRVEALAERDLAAWVHTGWQASPGSRRPAAG